MTRHFPRPGGSGGDRAPDLAEPCHRGGETCRLVEAAMTCFGRAAAGGAVGAIPSPGNSQAQYRSMQAPLEEYQLAGNRRLGAGTHPALV